MNLEQKKWYIQKIFLKIDAYNFKKYCILNDFKNLNINSILSPHYDNFSQDDIEFWTNEQIIELENRKDNLLIELMNLANLKKINLLEDQDLNYFIKFYKIKFVEEEPSNSFVIEI
jgi:hypothetical protein